MGSKYMLICWLHILYLLLKCGCNIGDIHTYHHQKKIEQEHSSSDKSIWCNFYLWVIIYYGYIYIHTYTIYIYTYTIYIDNIYIYIESRLKHDRITIPNRSSCLWWISWAFRWPGTTELQSHNWRSVGKYVLTTDWSIYVYIYVYVTTTIRNLYMDILQIYTYYSYICIYIYITQG